MELRLAVVALQALVSLIDWYVLVRHHAGLWSAVVVGAADCRLVAPASDLVVEKLRLHSLALSVGTAIKNLHGLLIVSILVGKHYLFTADLADHSRSV